MGILAFDSFKLLVRFGPNLNIQAREGVKRERGGRGRTGIPGGWRGRGGVFATLPLHTFIKSETIS